MMSTMAAGSRLAPFASRSWLVVQIGLTRLDLSVSVQVVWRYAV